MPSTAGRSTCPGPTRARTPRNHDASRARTAARGKRAGARRDGRAPRRFSGIEPSRASRRPPVPRRSSSKSSTAARGRTRGGSPRGLRSAHTPPAGPPGTLRERRDWGTGHCWEAWHEVYTAPRTRHAARRLRRSQPAATRRKQAASARRPQKPRCRPAPSEGGPPPGFGLTVPGGRRRRTAAGGAEVRVARTHSSRWILALKPRGLRLIGINVVTQNETLPVVLYRSVAGLHLRKRR